MENINKPHDWFAARFLNPDKTPEFLVLEGFSTENTKIEDKDFYKNKAKVQEFFKDENGNFDEKAFTEAHEKYTQEYQYLSNINNRDFVLQFYEKHPGVFSVPFGHSFAPTMDVSLTPNPLDQSFGVAAINEWSAPNISAREAAQKNRIWDSETQTWSEKTLNDYGALGILDKSLIYATDDEGNWKMDEFGNYYTETAGTGENLNKTSVTLSEVLTEDNSMMNKIDIFDSDNRESDLLKTAIRSAIIIGSTFTPAGSAIIYSTAALEFLKALPGIAKMVNGFINDSESETLNEWDNYMKKFSISQSDESLQKGFWSAENILNMMQDSFMQLTQQRAIAMLPNKLMGVGKRSDALFEAAKAEAGAAMVYGGATPTAAMRMSKSFNDAEKLLRNASKVSDKISKVYLTTTAMQDVFNQSRRYGFDQETSAWITMLSSLGMYGLLQTDYFRGLLTNNMDYELKREMKQVAKAFVDTMEETYKKVGIPTIDRTTVGNASKLNMFQKLGKKAKAFYENHMNQFASSGYASIPHGMIAEGVEETMEEVMQDSAVALTRGFKMLSATLSGETYSDNYRWEKTNPLARYTASFVGGAIGGGIFKTADLLHFKKGAYEQFAKMLGDHKQLGNKIIEYVADGYVDEVRSVFKDIAASGLPWVDKNLSAVTLKPTTDSNETISTVTFANIDDALLAMDSFIKSNGLNYGRENIGKVEQGQAARAGWLMDENMTELIYQDYLSNMTDLIKFDAKKTSLIKELDGLSDDEKASKRKEIKQYEDLIKEKTKDVTEIVQGKKDRYMGMIMLRSNPAILDNLIPTTKEAIAQHRFATSYDRLPSAYKSEIDKIFEDKQKGSIHELNLLKAWNIYKSLASDEDLKSVVSTIESNLSGYQNISIEDRDKLKVLEVILKSNPELANMDQYDFQKLLITLYNVVKYKNAPMLSSDHKQYVEDLDEDEFSFLDKFTFAASKVLSMEIDAVDEDGSVKKEWYTLNLRDTPLVKTVFDILTAVQSNLQTDPEYLKKLYEKEELTEQETAELRLYSEYGTPENYAEFIDDLQNWVNTFKNWELITNPVTDFITKYDDNSVIELISLLMSKKFDVEGFNILDFIDSENAAIATLGQNYRLSEESNKIIEQLNQINKILDALLHGASKDIVSFIGKTTPVGANSVLNQGFKDNEIKLELLELSGNSANTVFLTLSGLNNKIKKIIDAHLKNTGASISRDKRASVKRGNAMIKQLKDAFEKSLFDGLFVDVPELEEVEITDNMSDDALKDAGIKVRTQLRNFEHRFSEAFAQLSPDSKNLLAKKLREVYNPTLLDTTAIQNDEDKINVTDADLYWYLCSCTAKNPNNFDAKYLAWVKENSELCPFDSQEDVVLQAARMISLSGTDLDMWLDKGGKLDTRPVLNSVVKIFGLGGVGKTSALIPLVVYLSGKSVSMLTNNISQKQNLQKAFGDSVEIKLIDEFNKNYDAEIQKYSSGETEHIIIIDEATNIYSKTDKKTEGKSDISKWNESANNYGNRVKFVTFGDYTQCGVDSNIYHTIGAMTRQLDESVRAQLDILRINIQTAKSAFGVDEHGRESVDKSKAMTMNYYETDTEFYGHKFEEVVVEGGKSEQDALVERAVNFINLYRKSPEGNDRTFLIYTTDKVVQEQITNAVSGKQGITFASSVTQVQGAEWDYVIVLDKFKFDNDGIVKQYNTLVSRPKLGFISVPVQKGWKINNISQDRPPVAIGLSPEELNEFKAWKIQMLEQVKLATSDSGTTGESDTGRSTLPPISFSTPASHDSNARITPSFIPKSDFEPKLWQENLKWTSEDEYLYDRMILYTAITSNFTDAERIAFLKNNLKNQNILSYQFALHIRTGDNTENILDLGNRGDLAKWISPRRKHTWLVFVDPSNPENKIHLGMFFTIGAKVAGLPDSAFTSAIHSQKSGLYQIPRNWKICRDRNPLHIRPDYMQSGESKLTSQEDRNIFRLSKTPAIFMSSYEALTAPGQKVVREILAALKVQKNLYESIFNSAKSYIGLDDDIKISNYLHLRKIIGYDQHSSELYARGVPDLDHKFVFFVSSNPNTNLQNVPLTTTLTNYLNQILQWNTVLLDVESKLKSMSADDSNEIIEEIGQTLNSSTVMDNISAVSCSPGANTMSDKEVADYFRNNFKNDSSDYSVIVAEQVLTLLKRIAYISGKSWKADKGFTTEDHKVIKKWWTENKDSIEEKLKIRYKGDEPALKDWFYSIATIIGKLYEGEDSIANKMSRLNGWFLAEHKPSNSGQMSSDIHELWVYPKLIADSGETLNNLGAIAVAQNEHMDSNSVIQLAQIQVYNTGENNFTLQPLKAETPIDPDPNPEPPSLDPEPGPNPIPEDGEEMPKSEEEIVREVLAGVFSEKLPDVEVDLDDIINHLSDSAKEEIVSAENAQDKILKQLEKDDNDRDEFIAICRKIDRIIKLC